MQQYFRFLWVALFVMCAELVSGQVITSDPLYPVPGEPVTLTFYANNGNGALAGHTGELYAHTGVVTDESSSTSDWKYVVTEWDENIEKTQLTSLGNDAWELTIQPDIYSYYGVPADEEILQLAFVFRNADGTVVGRDTDGGDIFVNVYGDPYHPTWNAPNPATIYSIGDQVTVDVVVLAANALTLDIDDQEVAFADGNSLTHTFTVDNAGDYELVLHVEAPDSVYSDTISIFVRSETPVAELPFEGLKDGINYIDDQTVTLVLYAPHKEFVVVNSSYTDWQLSQENQMYRTPDSLRYWITFENVEPGREYAFQYIVDGEITIADPYTDKVLDPWNDQYIPSSTYPYLMEYPHGHAEGILSVFETGQEPYNWQIDSFERPANEELVIYELLVRDFVEEANYQTLIDTIAYLKNLGVNAIELMPVSEFEGNSSWGYNPSFYFAPDKYYGTKNDLKAFVDVCHQNGMAVILDMVLNHSFGQSPFVQLYFDAAAGEYGEPTAENPWYNRNSPNPTYYWGFDFNHESEQTIEFVSRVNKYWLTEYKFDGFRFDFTKGFTNTPGEGWEYDQARINILKAMADTIWNTAPGAYVILEHLTDNSEERVLSNYGMLLWGNMNHAYSQASMGYTQESSLSGISYKSRSWTKPHLVGYMESHDEERQMFKNQEWGNGTIVYDITQPEIGLRRGELTSLFFLTVPGPKMIWQFGELGYDYSIDFDCRVCEKPVRWDYWDDDYRRHLYHFYAQVIQLRKNYSIFQTDDFTIRSTEDVKTIHFETPDTAAFIVGNFGVEPQMVTLDLDAQYTWYSVFEKNIEVQPDTSFLLQPGAYRMYITHRVQEPAWPAFPGALTPAIEGSARVNDTLFANYTFFDLDGDEEATSEYQWYRSDDTLGTNKEIIEGATSRWYVPVIDDVEKSISFAVTPVANSSEYARGLPAESQLTEPVQNAGSSINVYPVPSQGMLQLENVTKYSTVELLNTSGQIVDYWPTDGAYAVSVNVADLQSGMYFLRFVGSGASKVKKIVKIP
ncbi:MAG: alpha-amylase family glycosyl hydrolase [Salinivirgaceae bacterium]